MADLYPTKVRVALLRDVDEHRVRDDAAGVPMLHWNDDDAAQTCRIDVAMRELSAAGWVEPGDVNTWHLTEAGRRVLEEHAHG